MDKIKVLILEVPGEKRNYLVETLLNIDYISLVGELDNVLEARQILNSQAVDVILLGYEVENNGYEISEQMSLEYPSLTIILIEEIFSKENVQKAMFSGAGDVLVYPMSASNLVDSIYKSNQLTKQKIELLKQSEKTSNTRSRIGEIFTIYSPKGGVGKTFIASNLATSLIKNTNKKVVVVDLDFDHGGIAISLNINPKFTITDIIDDIRSIDKDYIESFLAVHESGLRILPVDLNHESIQFITSEYIDIIIRNLQDAYDYIIIDMPYKTSDILDSAFLLASKLLIVVTQEVSTIRNVKDTLINLNNLNYQKSKVKILLNKKQKSNINEKDIETTLNHDIYISMQNDNERVLNSLNIGIPYVTLYSKKPLAKEIGKLSGKLIKE